MDRTAVLESIVPNGVTQNVNLAALSRWKVGGKADHLVRPRTTAEILALRRWLWVTNTPHLYIGGTTNLLFSDAGLRAVCIQLGNNFAATSVNGTRITAQAGAWAPSLALRAMREGYEGIEHICGIPGTLGGLVCMNGGSLRRGIGEVVEWVESIDTSGVIQRRTADQCGFTYRRSIFQQNNEVITRVCIYLNATSDQATVRRRMIEILRSRRKKFPKALPNCGSVFVSNPAMYARYGSPGAVIEALGLKGLRIGDALVSPHHANFIVNMGQATAADIRSLISEVRSRVLADTGYLMRTEVLYVEPNGRMQPAAGDTP